MGNVAANTIDVMGIGISFVVGVDAYYRDDNAGVQKAGIEIIMTGVGSFGGPLAFVISTVYFLIDPLDPNKGINEAHNEEITPIDNLGVNKKIMTLDEQVAMKVRQLNK